jgi:alkylation response protein AidB-like acyl-CoA dehydrogenase
VDIGLQIVSARGLLRSQDGVTDPLASSFEKLFRDAKSYRIADGENGFLSLLGGTGLLGSEYKWGPERQPIRRRT